MTLLVKYNRLNSKDQHFI